LRVRRAGYQAWRAEILPLLDPARMRDPLTNAPMTPARFEQGLRASYDAIATDGFSKLTPSGAAGGGALANTRAEHRFLIFRNAEAWLAYQDRFGASDPFSAMMAHVDGMARDIAAIEVLGPNPAATLRYMEDIALKDAAQRDAQAGGSRTMDRTRRQLAEARHMYDAIRGTANAPINGAIGRSFAGLRSFLVSAQLGSAAISALTDLNFQRIAARHAGISYARVLGQYARLLNPVSAGDRELAVRLGLIAEGWASVASSAMRYVGEVAGSEVTRRLSDFVLRASFLEPWTQAGRWAFGMEFMGFLARHAGQGFNDLPPALQRTFARYGLTAAHWKVLRNTPLYAHGGAQFLRPADVADRALGTRLLEMIQGETAFAVPAASVRGAVAITGGTRPGTLLGELARSVAMYKNFGVTLVMTHILRGLQSRGLGRRGMYFADLLISTTIAGALALQLKEIAKGRDPREMFGKHAPEFWGAALLQGGGLGIFGDFLFSDVNRFGGGLPETVAGPVVGFLNDVRRLTLGNLVQLPGDKPTNAGRELVNFLRRYTPGGSIWYARLGYERLILDRLQELADPQAARRFRALEGRARRDFDQAYWWRPGRALPDRGPAFQRAIGERR
jgi:hypothetical protein